VKFSNMDKNSIVIVLLVLQLMATFTSTAHHEAKDLGAAAANFFGGINTPVKPNVVQMPEPDDHEHSDDVDETGEDDFVDVGMDEEDTDRMDPFVDDGIDLDDDGIDLDDDGIDLDDEDIDLDDDDIDLDDDDFDLMDGDDFDLMDMDLEKHLQMHQGHVAHQEHNEDVHKPLFPHLSTDDDLDDEAKIDNMASKMKKMDNMASKMKQMDNMASKMNPKMKQMDIASTKSQYPTLQKVYAQESSPYPTYETASTYAPQAYDAYPTYDTSPYGQRYNEYQTPQVHYVPVVHVQKKNHYQHHSRGQYNNQYPKKLLAKQSKYYQTVW